MTEGIPVDVFEKRAADQRRHLHSTVVDLRASVREKMDVKHNVRNHLGLAAGALAVVGLGLGYVFTGIFTRN
ncbi:MAG TPA: hypothetical protein VJW55_05170 [Candidatus Angelobacter sp.]|jgi:hypothetical protein|nr:hypothetical protein [Candidatus Angelobacter sp.]